MKEVDFLARVSIFSHMKKGDLKRIAKLARQHQYNKGDVIIEEGERDGTLFVVLSGEVKVFKDYNTTSQTYLGKFGPNGYFGEMALIDDMVRSASVVATMDTRVLCLDQWNLRQAIEKYPVIALELMQMLSRRLRAIEKNMVKTLGRLLPICSNCKRIREENGSWRPIEEYIGDHTEAEFSHSICPACSKSMYPELTGNPEPSR